MSRYMRIVLKVEEFRHYMMIREEDLGKRIRLPIRKSLTFPLTEKSDMYIQQRILEFEYVCKHETCPVCGEDLPVYELVN